MGTAQLGGDERRTGRERLAVTRDHLELRIWSSGLEDNGKLSAGMATCFGSQITHLAATLASGAKARASRGIAGARWSR